MKSKLLLITDHFPPKASIACLRMSAIAKYLDRDQWDVYVLTDASEQSSSQSPNVRRVSNDHWLKRKEFLRPVPPLIHNLKALYNRSCKIFTVDANPGFYSHGRVFLRDWFAKENFAAVISSYGSVAPLKLGYFLKREFQNFHWICDFRDEMEKNEDANAWDRLRLGFWERKVTRHADMLVSVSAPILKQFSVRHPEIPAIEIRNGFDFEPIREPAQKSDYLQVIYIGSLYLHINLDNFFAGWLALPEDLRKKMRLKVVGSLKNQGVPEELKAWVEFFDKVPYEKVPSLLAASDAFLLVNPKGRRAGVYTGKLFDYLAVNRPIIGLTDPGDVAAQLIHRANAGYTVANENVEGIRATLETLIRDWESSRLLDRRWEVIEEHHRSRQVKKLNDSLIELVASGRPEA